MQPIELEFVVNMGGDVDETRARLYSSTSKYRFERGTPACLFSFAHRHAGSFRKSAMALHPGAMYRLGTAELNGELSLATKPKEGVKWLKRSAEHATAEFPHALHELALLHERGIENVLFVDLEYATELLAQAAELGYPASACKLGECYEYGKMGCPMDPALSIHYYVRWTSRVSILVASAHLIPFLGSSINHRILQLRKNIQKDHLH